MALLCDWIDSGTLSAETVMQKDAWLLDRLASHARPFLHFYNWERPSLTYGYFANPHHDLHVDRLDEKGLHMARRPTGGGIIFHLTDLTFSFFVPSHCSGFSLNTLDNYRFVNQQVSEIIGRIIGKPIDLLPFDPVPVCEESAAFCMAKPTQYDLMVEGKKVGGAAQRRKRQGFLHQATLSLAFPSETLLQQLLKHPDSVLREMKRQSGFLFPSMTEQERGEVYKEIQEELKKKMLF